MPSEVVRDAILPRVTLATGKVRIPAKMNTESGDCEHRFRSS